METIETLAGRFAFVERTGPKGSATWVGRDVRSGARVLAASLPASRVAALEGLVGLTHDHLAGILSLVHDPAKEALPAEARSPKLVAVAVSEHVVGALLQQALGAGALHVREAVELTLALARAVAVLHRAGGVHGAISPRNVVVEPEAPRAGPVLCHFLSSANGAYCCAERVGGGGPSASDDVWALHAVLFAALVGRPPFAGKSKSELANDIASWTPERLRAAGVADDDLARIVDAGLTPDPSARRTVVSELVDALEEWVARRSVKPPAPARGARVYAPIDPDEEEDETQLFRPDDVAEALSALVSSDLGADVEESDSATRIMVSPVIEQARGVDPAPPSRAQALAAPLGSDPAHAAPSAALPQFRLDEPLPPVPVGYDPIAPPALRPPSPPAAPAPLAPVAMRPGRAPTTFPRELVAVVVVLAILLAAALTVLFVRRGSSAPDSRVTPAAPAPGVAPPTEGSAAATPRSVPVALPPPTRPRLGECVGGFFEKGTFTGDEDFEFVCSEQDFRGVNSLLYRAIVVAGTGKVTPGMREWSTLGWYELGVTAIVRHTCCPGAPRIDLPAQAGPCTAMVDLLPALTEDTSEPAARAEAYAKALRCYYANGVARPFEYSEPTGANRRAFQAFLERNPGAPR